MCIGQSIFKEFNIIYILPLTIAGSTEYIILKRMFQRQIFTLLFNLYGYCIVSDV